MEPPTPAPTTTPTGADSVTHNGANSSAKADEKIEAENADAEAKKAKTAEEVVEEPPPTGGASSSGAITDKPTKAPKAPLRVGVCFWHIFVSKFTFCSQMHR